LSEQVVELDLPASLPSVQPVRSEACAVSDGCFELPLRRDANADPIVAWNLVGTPFLQESRINEFRFETSDVDGLCNAGCAMDAASRAGYTNSYVWVYNSESNRYDEYAEGDVLRPWQGFWVNSLPESHSLGLQLNMPYIRSADNIVFETDFSQDTGYRLTNAGFYSTDAPTGWDGALVSNDSVAAVESGAGINGSNALRLSWGTQSQPTISLAKHLTGNENTGFDELYIRYNVRLPNNFKAGSDGTDMKHWKWGRMWQNTSPRSAPTESGRWTENRANSGYVVWGVGSPIPWTRWSSVWSENFGQGLESGSAGGPKQGVDWFVSNADSRVQDGYFESMADGAWAFDPARPGFLANTQQQYHTLEFHFKLATSDEAEDAVFELWFDGVKQDPWTRIGPGLSGGGPQRSGIPTTNRGSGFNFFLFFDNLAQWNRHWAQSEVDGYIDVNDVVVSTQYIGHNYRVIGTNDNIGN